MKNRLIFFLFLMLTATLFSTQTYEVSFEELQLSGITYDNRLPMIYEPGNPCLPYQPITILVPQNMQLSDLRISKHGEKITPDTDLNYVREQQTISFPKPDNTQKNSVLYALDEIYPKNDYKILDAQSMNGYQIVTVMLYPYRYNPAQKELIVYNQFTVEPVYTRSAVELDTRMLSIDRKTQEKIGRLVINPEVVAGYSRSIERVEATLPDPSEPYDMIIITGTDQLPWFTEYAQWKTNHGVLTNVVSVQDIYTEYAGVDHAEQLRYFIIDAYQAYAGSSNPLKYILLGGDDEIIPIRGVYGIVGDTTDMNMPSDLYYACLDGSWDGNVNFIYGETDDNVDFYPEISVGRIPAESENEFNNFFNKAYHYVDDSSYSNNKASMFGENLNMDPVTWGGDYKDEILNRMPDTYLMETHYQRDGTFSREEVMEAINNGVNVMNHMGHANQSTLLGMSTSNISALTNTEFGFLFSQGCYPAAFDEVTSLAGESIGENLIFRPGGLMAFIGNTRYGWYYPGSTDGASQFYDRSYFDALYEEDIRELGEAYNYCLVDNVTAAQESDVMRWCYYELILFGDPSIQVKDPVPNMPNLEVVDITYSDELGDDDGNINPGETVIITPTIHNIEGWATAEQVTAELVGVEAPITITQNMINFGQVPANGTVVNDDSYFTIDIPYDIELRDFDITINLRAYSNGEELFSRDFYSSFSVNLINGNFPWFTNVSSKSAPVVLDYDNNGENEILYADNFGGISVLSIDGVMVDSISTDRQENLLASFAVADIDEDGYQDFIFASRLGNIYAIDRNGDYVFDYTDGGLFNKNPVVADINNDGHLETIAMDLQNNIYVLDYQGTPLAGFPKAVDYGAGIAPAIADLDQNGSNDFIIGGSTGMLYAYNYEGNVLAGFPVDLGAPINSSPTILDDNSIAVATGSQLFRVSATGTIEASMDIPNSIANSVIATDFLPNVEGLEIGFVTSNGAIYIVTNNLEVVSGFPIDSGMLHAWPPLAGDIDSNGTKELITISQTNNIVISQRDGSPFIGFPYNLCYNGHQAAQLSDLDSDGDLDIVCGVDLGIMVVDTKRPYNGYLDWMIFRGDLARTGNYNLINYVENDEDLQIPIVTKLDGNYPNPFNPTTTINFALAKAQKVSLSVYNIKGQKVKTLINESRGVGNHSVIWDGLDENDKSVSSGVYLYRLKTGGRNYTEKMSLIK